MDHAALKTEINNDPKSLGYAALVASGSDLSIANLLNQMTGNGAETITLPSLPRDDFLVAILPAVAGLVAASPTLQAKWNVFLNVATSANNIDLVFCSPYLDMLVSDGLVTQNQRNAIGARTGSRAEVLFGAGTVVSHNDVAIALRS